MYSASNIHKVSEFNRKPTHHLAESTDYADSIINIRQAISEHGRPLKEFTDEFENRHGRMERKL